MNNLLYSFIVLSFRCTVGRHLLIKCTQCSRRLFYGLSKESGGVAHLRRRWEAWWEQLSGTWSGHWVHRTPLELLFCTSSGHWVHRTPLELLYCTWSGPWVRRTPLELLYCRWSGHWVHRTPLELLYCTWSGHWVHRTPLELYCTVHDEVTVYAEHR